MRSCESSALRNFFCRPSHFLLSASPRLRSARRRLTGAKADCAKFVKDADESSARMGIKIRVATGSWGNVPRELQKLPPGAQHCGALMEQAVIMSPAFGKDLETFYAPLFAKIGCQPFACEVENISGGSRTECKCRGNGKIKMGQIVTDLSYEAFVLSVM